MEPQRKPGCFSVPERQITGASRLCAEECRANVGFSRHHLVAQLLVACEFADERQHQSFFAGYGGTYFQTHGPALENIIIE